jgi:hypothetical protein
MRGHSRTWTVVSLRPGLGDRRAVEVPRRGASTAMRRAVATEVKISVLADLRDGRFERGGLDLLFSVMQTQLRRLPVLHVNRQLHDDLVWDFVQDFLDQRWQRTVTALLAEATDDDSMTRLLHRIVRNWLIDQVRKTDQGSVLRRLKDHLESEPAFEAVPAGEPGASRWRLAGSVESPWGGRIDDLVAAAHKVPATAIRWSDPTRRPPIATAADLTAILREVMIAADRESLDLQQLTFVIMHRFPATLDPESRSVDPADDVLAALDATPDVELLAQVEASDMAAAARRVFGQLTAEERHLLPLILDQAAVQARFGCGRSTAYNRINKLKELMRELVGSYEDPEQVAGEVLALCMA